MVFVRKRLTSTEGQPPDTRYNEDTDTVETSTDGGATWTPNPGADPRVNPAYLLPPNTAPDVKCAAADGMVTYIEQVVTAGIDGSTIAGIANVLLGAVLVFLPISWLFALLLIVGEALLAIGGAALSFAFTEDVYDQIRCILYDRVDADGRLDAAALTAAQGDVDAIGDVTVSAVFGLIVQMVGHVGLSNAGAKYANSEAECDCLRWCRVFDFTIDDGGFTVFAGEAGVYDPGFGWRSALLTAGEFYQLCSIARELPISGDTVIDFVSAVFDYTSGDNPLGTYLYADSEAPGDRIGYSAPEDGTDKTVFTDGYETDTTHTFGVNVCPGYSGVGDPGGSSLTKEFRVHGRGTPPEWGEDCS